MTRLRWFKAHKTAVVLAAVITLAGVSLVGVAVSQASGAGDPKVQVALPANVQAHVSCAGALTVTSDDVSNVDADCAAPTTVPATTTTVPQTTTTVPATTTTTQPPPPGGFPDASNTGVPTGTTLTAYTGPTTITSCGTVIDGKILPSGLTVKASNGTHSASTPCVTIRNSKITGVVMVGYSGAGPTVLDRDEIVGQKGSTTPPLWQDNFFANALNVHGGRGQIDCDGICTVTNSYVHDEDYAGATHMQAFETNGQTAGDGVVTLDHNTFWCNPAGNATGSGGCAADVSFFGDNANVNGSIVKNNLFKASTGQFGYCVYTGGSEPSKPYGTGTNLDWENNTFERGRSGKCGDAGPVADWAYNSGNVWAGNRYDDGTAINP